jgi:hypothetical protein
MLKRVVSQVDRLKHILGQMEKVHTSFSLKSISFNMNMMRSYESSHYQPDGWLHIKADSHR